MSERLSAEQLAEIRERAEKATAGPWVVFCPRGTRYHVKNFKRAFILEHLDPHDIRRGADSEFIAHARTDIPALLADRDVLEAELQEARERLHARALVVLGDDRKMRDVILISDFKQQLVAAVRAMPMIYDRTSRENIINLIQSFNPAPDDVVTRLASPVHDEEPDDLDLCKRSY